MINFYHKKTQLDYSDVLIVPTLASQVESRNDVSVVKSYKFLHSGMELVSAPIIAANMDGVGTINMHDALIKHSCQTALSKYLYSPQELLKIFDQYKDGNAPILSIGTGDFSILEYLMQNAAVRIVNIDVANGYMDKLEHFVRRVRDAYPNLTIIAGNVVTAERTKTLVNAGADIVKVGIGPGSCCTTRLVTGVGYPQLSAVSECVDAADELGAHVIADGGCTNSGDVVKALAVGADFVMLGGMLAGHTESGTVIDSHVEFYGMSSEDAMNKHHGGVADYRASEGKAVRVPYRGDVSGTIKDILGGIRSACAYVNAKNVDELPVKARFVKVNNQNNKVFG